MFKPSEKTFAFKKPKEKKLIQCQLCGELILKKPGAKYCFTCKADVMSSRKRKKKVK